MAIAILLCAVLGSASLDEGAPRPQEGSDEQLIPEQGFRSPEAGFAIQNPDASWTLKTVPGEFGIKTLAMGPAERGGSVQFSIQISVASAADATALRRQRDALLEETKNPPGIEHGKAAEYTIAGMEAPGLEVQQESGGVTYRVRQAFLVSQGLQYKFQFHAPHSEYDRVEGLFDQALASFETLPLDASSQDALQLPALAARCGSEVEWLEDWDEAASRARAEDKWIVVTVQAISGFEVGDQIGRGPFMDLDVVRLLRERFIVLRWHKGMGAPFEQQNVFGMGPSTFGMGLLVVTPKGEVERQVFLLEGPAVYDALQSVLKEQVGMSPPSTPENLTRKEGIEFLLHSGQLELAAAHLASLDSSGDPVQEGALRAELHRLRRNGERALTEVRTALSILDLGSQRRVPVRNSLLLLRAGLLAATGVPDSAETIVRRLLEPDSEASPEARSEALMMLGSLRYQARDVEGTESAWGQLVSEFPESRWSWMVAGVMTGPMWGLEVYPNLSWPEERHRRLIRIPELAENHSSDVGLDPMIESAAEYLIASQQQDGSWISATTYGDVKELGDDFELAATAIGGRALLRLKYKEEAQSAALDGLNWMHAWRALLEEQDSPPVVFMDYAVWSRSYVIFFLADCIDAGLGDEAAVRSLLAKHVTDLLDRQQQNGGWSYYLSGTAGGAAVPQSISFTTATVVMALERAAEVGCKAGGDALSRGLDCLEAMRSPHHTFGYFLNGRDVATGRRTADGVEASAARGPACALALLRGHRESSRDMRNRMELYVEHLPAFGAQRRKALMHAGLHTQGSHYLLYDYSTAAEALRELNAKGLSPGLRHRVKAALLRELRACRNRDGSFLDNPLIGPDIGTGLALSCLLDLRG